MKRILTRADLERDPHAVWNTFIDLIAMEDPADLTHVQRQARFVFEYDADVHNGGHGQYLENWGLDHAVATVQALLDLGLKDQSRILSGVVTVLQQRGGAWDEVLEDGVIEELDAEFHRCEPTVDEALARHLAEHRAEYIEFV